MKRFSIAPLFVAVLLTSFAVAQRGNGMGGGWAGNSGAGWAGAGWTGAGAYGYAPWTGSVTAFRGGRPGRPGPIGPIRPCAFGRCNGNGGFGYGYGAFWPGYYAPFYGDYDGYWSLREPMQPPPQPEPQPTERVIVVQAQQPPSPQRLNVQDPKMVEVPLPSDKGDKNAAATKPLPAAIFILTNGERLQSNRYTLTYDTLQIQQNRRNRVIPLNALDVDATIAANKAQGVDLQIPQNSSEMTLGF